MKKTILALAFLGLATGMSLADSGRGYMGVTVVGVGHDKKGVLADGVYITAVRPGTGAETAGLKPSDRIVSINNINITGTADLDDALGGSAPGQTVTISVLREDQEQSFQVVLGDKPEATLDIDGHGNRRFGKWVIESADATPRMGVALQPLGKQLAGYFQVDSGMLITRVVEDSGAWNAGLQAGDVLLEVGGQGIAELGDLRTALREFEAGDTVDLTVQRRGSIDRFAVTLDEAATLTAGEMSFTVALHGEGGGHGDQDVRVKLMGTDEALGDQGEPVLLRFGDGPDEAALKRQIHELQMQLHHLRQELERRQDD